MKQVCRLILCILLTIVTPTGVTWAVNDELLNCEQDNDRQFSKTDFAIPSSNIKCYYGSFLNPMESVGLAHGFSSHTYYPAGTQQNDVFFSYLPTNPSPQIASIKVGAGQVASGYCYAMDYQFVPLQDTIQLLVYYAATMRTTPGYHAGGYKHMSMQAPFISMQLLDESLTKIDGSEQRHEELEPNFWIEYDGPHPSDQYTNTTAYYHPWDTYTITIIGHKNEVLTFRSLACGCEESYCYADLYLSLTPLQLLSFCCVACGVALSAPKGFQYQWYRSTDETCISTQRTIGVEADGALYKCIVYDSVADHAHHLSIFANTYRPQAQFKYNIHPGVCGDTLVITNQTKPMLNDQYDPLCTIPISYQWIFGDGQTSQLANPSPTVFTASGEYPVCLTAYMNNQHCTSIYCDTIHIEADYQYRQFYDTICDGDSFGRGSRLYSSSGIYLDTIFDAICQDSIFIEEHLFVAPIYSMPIITDTICKGEYYVWNGHTYNQPGYYECHLQSMFGCDSIVALELIQLGSRVQETTQFDTICSGTSYIWNGHPYYQAGYYTDTLLAVSGCDSIVHLDLETYLRYSAGDFHFGHWNDPFVTPMDTSSFGPGDHWNPPFPTEEDSLWTNPSSWNDPYLTQEGVVTFDTVCGMSYSWRGHTYVKSGLYMDTVFSIHGCDSVLYLNLQLLPMNFDTLIHFMDYGDEFKWRGKIYTQDGIYGDTVPQEEGACDSIFYLDLHVCNAHVVQVSDTSFCENDRIVWHSKLIDQLGVYYDTLRSCRDCDSIVYQLNVSSVYTSSSDTLATICKRQLPMLWHGKEYRVAGNYKDTLINVFGCDSVVTLHLTVESCAPLPPPNPRFCDTVYSDTFLDVYVHQLPYVWNGVSCTKDTVLSVNLLSIERCDSMATLHLHVLEKCELPTITLPYKFYRK